LGKDVDAESDEVEHVVDDVPLTESMQ
jgi:hypothetical protein